VEGQATENSGTSVIGRLAPLITAVLAGFIIIGVALPVLPLHVRDDLGFGTIVVGLVAGAQFAAAIVSRVWAGSFADRRGAKRSVLAGLTAASAAGVLYILSVAFSNSPQLSICILLAGRAILGGAESFIITGGIAWGLGSVDKAHAGKVIAWVGTAMFAALALGGPFGSVLYGSFGFLSVALVTTLLPLIVLVLLAGSPAVATHQQGRRSNSTAVLRAVWLPGLGAAMASIGYCSILAFSPLLYAEMGWYPVWLAFTSFGVALVAARMVAGHLPDRLGGARVALLFCVIQAAGLSLMWVATTPWVASAGAALAGFGYSLVYPGLGVEAIRATSPKDKGLAMGIFTVFLDVAMAAGSPTLGWLGGRFGLKAIFVVSAMVVLGTAVVSGFLLRSRSSATDYQD
jgi:MFS family permease